MLLLTAFKGKNTFLIPFFEIKYLLISSFVEEIKNIFNFLSFNKLISSTIFFDKKRSQIKGFLEMS
ncbi:hypothetical protein HNQ02_002552 [Flavobacterium sp. 7E]|nr:hypothetical protein [Flavobacterium sp. 7E]